jgi:hypothetical protein
MGMGDGSAHRRPNPLLENGVRYVVVILEQTASFRHGAFSAMCDIAAKALGKLFHVMTGMYECIS